MKKEKERVFFLKLKFTMAKILYVEDNLSLSFVTSDQLKKRGYQVVTCKDGKEALSTFNKDIFDLCILDVMLPIIDGFELAKKKLDMIMYTFPSFFYLLDRCKKIK